MQKLMTANGEVQHLYTAQHIQQARLRKMLVMRLAREKVSATSWLLQVVRLTEYLHRGESKDGLLHHGFVDKNTIRGHQHHGFVDNKVQKLFQNASL